MHCCHVGCSAAPAVSIHLLSPASLSETYDDVHACVEHVGALLPAKSAAVHPLPLE